MTDYRPVAASTFLSELFLQVIRSHGRLHVPRTLSLRNDGSFSLPESVLRQLPLHFDASYCCCLVSLRSGLCDEHIIPGSACNLSLSHCVPIEAHLFLGYQQTPRAQTHLPNLRNRC